MVKSSITCGQGERSKRNDCIGARSTPWKEVTRVQPGAQASGCGVQGAKSTEISTITN